MDDTKIPLCHKTVERDTAIRNMGGLVWLYEKHLTAFLDTYSDSYEQIKFFLLCGEYEKAHIMVHSIKGLSGTLGLYRLHQSASVLEQEIKSASPEVIKFLSEYKICLHETIQALNNGLQPEPRP